MSSSPTLSPGTLADPDHDPLGDRLVNRGKLRASELKRVQALPRKPGETLATLLSRLDLVAENDIVGELTEILGMAPLQARDYPDAVVSEAKLSPRFLKSAHVIPIDESEHDITLAMADPRELHITHAVGVACGKAVVPRLGLKSDIDNAIERCYGEGHSELGRLAKESDQEQEAEPDVEQLRDMASEAPVVRMVNLLIQRAVDARASDIHLEPFEDRLIVRYRIDGVLREVEGPSAKLTAAVVSRIKIMSKLNIAERRLPQDGRIMLKVRGKEIDFRVSTVPTLYGESVVMRLLDKKGLPLNFESLGFAESQGAAFKEILAMPHGIVLVTGPTGSGKTTTLYAALNHLNTIERKILTVEDPVEYQLHGINQIHVKPQIGMDFASALRSILRQDPDVIMIGEMRDVETARIAVQSALTGHLVLSTLHTNDAASGITRMLDMGVEDYLLTSTVNAILAQRLVRTLCSHCRSPYPALPETVTELRLDQLAKTPQVTLYKPVGCEHCDGTGFQGRTAVLEFLVLNDEIRRLVLQHAEAHEIQKAARRHGMLSMYEDGLLKALGGHTTVDEVLRVTQEF
jgi:general secretion pathway protein E